MFSACDQALGARRRWWPHPGRAVRRSRRCSRARSGACTRRAHPAARPARAARVPASVATSMPSTSTCAAVGLHQRVEHAQGGGLAGAVGAEQAGDLAVARVEAHAVHGLDRTVLAVKDLCRSWTRSWFPSVEAGERRGVGQLGQALGVERLGVGGVDELRHQLAACSRRRSRCGPGRAGPGGVRSAGVFDHRIAVARRGDRIELAGQQQCRHRRSSAARGSRPGACPSARPRTARPGSPAKSLPSSVPSSAGLAFSSLPSSLQITDSCMPMVMLSDICVAQHLRQRHQRVVAAVGGLVQLQRQQRRRQRHVGVHAHQPGDQCGRQLFLLAFAGDAVAVGRPAADRSPASPSARAASRAGRPALHAGRGLGAERELQVQRVLQVAGELVAQHQRVGRHAVQHDRARAGRVLRRVLLGHARAVGNADQVDLSARRSPCAPRPGPGSLRWWCRSAGRRACDSEARQRLV